MITKFTASNAAPSFSARLFNQNNLEVKAFDLYDELSGINNMETRGDKSTDIFVHDFISKKNAYGEYENAVDLTIKNPLFGEQRFIHNLHHNTNTPVKGSLCDEIWHLDLLTGLKSNNCKDLENKAFRMSLIEEIKNNLDLGKTREITPDKILTNKLVKYIDNKTLTFSDGRIMDFYKIAENLLVELIKNGIDIIKK